MSYFAEFQKFSTVSTAYNTTTNYYSYYYVYVMPKTKNF